MDEETTADLVHDCTGPAEKDFDPDQLPPEDFEAFATSDVEKEEE